MHNVENVVMCTSSNFKFSNFSELNNTDFAAAHSHRAAYTVRDRAGELGRGGAVHPGQSQLVSVGGWE